MCGRTACTLAPDDVIRACCYNDRQGHRRRPVWKDAPGGQNYWPSHNIAPTAHTPVLVQTSDNFKTESACERIVTPMKWGLTPPWHKGDPYKVQYETNNCRAEGMLDKKTYKIPLQKGNRCVVIADGYFEWKTTPQGKQPYFFYFPQPDLIGYPGQSVEAEVKSDKNQVVAQTELHSSVVQELKEKTEEETRQSCNTEIAPTKQTDSKGTTQQVASFRHSFPPSNGSNSLSEQKSDLGNGDFASVTDIKTEDASIDIKREDSDTLTEIKREDGNTLTEIKNEVNTKVSGLFGHNNKDNEEDCQAWHGQRLLTMAAVYDVWHPPDGAAPLYSYSVITVEAAPDISWCHHRMPAILSTEEEVQDWLDSANIPLQKACALIKSHKGLKFHPVSKSVNNSRYKSADCVKPVDLCKPKDSPSSNMMMSWLKNGSPAKKKKLTDSS